MRVIGFNPKVSAVLLKSVDEKCPVAIKNCHIQKSRSSSHEELEVVIDSSTKINESTVEIDITSLPPTEYGTLDAVLLTSPNQEIIVRAKVIASEEPMKVKEWTKQD